MTRRQLILGSLLVAILAAGQFVRRGADAGDEGSVSSSIDPAAFDRLAGAKTFDDVRAILGEPEPLHPEHPGLHAVVLGKDPSWVIERTVTCSLPGRGEPPTRREWVGSAWGITATFAADGSMILRGLYRRWQE